MEKKTKRWWIVNLTNEQHDHEDNWLEETTLMFWGTKTDALSYTQANCFTKKEVALMKKGKRAKVMNSADKGKTWQWEGTFERIEGMNYYVECLGYDDERMRNAPYLKHELLIDLARCQVFMNLTPESGYVWPKCIKVSCLDQGGVMNTAMAKSLTKAIGSYIEELQSTIK